MIRRSRSSRVSRHSEDASIERREPSKIGDKFKRAFKKVGNAFKKGWQGFKKKVVPVLGKIANVAVAAMRFIPNPITQAISAAATVAMRVKNAVSLAKGVKKAVGAAKHVNRAVNAYHNHKKH